METVTLSFPTEAASFTSTGKLRGLGRGANNPLSKRKGSAVTMSGMLPPLGPPYFAQREFSQAGTGPSVTKTQGGGKIGGRDRKW